MFTNQEILRIAMEQSALDLNCSADDFLKSEHVIVRSSIGPSARKYYEEPVACSLVSYGSNLIASVKDEYRSIYELRLMRPEEFAGLYTEQWGNALCEARKELDVLMLA